MSVITLSNQKGGIGKTTLSFNLAKGLAARGKRVLAVDHDPQANLTSSFLKDPEHTLKAKVNTFYSEDALQVEPQQLEPNLFLIGADIHLAKVAESDFEVIFKLREGLEPLTKEFDVIIVDGLPSFGYLHMAALNAADYVLIPVKPAPYALSGLKDLFDTIERIQKRLNPKLEVAGIILNLVETTVIAQQLEEVLREQYESLVLKTKIKKAVRLEESPAFYQSVMEYQPESKTATEITALIDEVMERVNL